MPPGQSAQLLFNGFRLTLSAEEFEAYTLPLPDNSQLKALRAAHPDWFLSWRDGTVYALARVPHPATIIGTPTRLRCSDHLPFLVALIDNLLPRKFPSYESFRRRPFAFIGKRDELVGSIAKQLRQSPALLRGFAIRPTFMLEAKIIEPTPNETSIGLFLTVNTKWEITADPEALDAAHVDLAGLYVVRRHPVPDERRLVGQIQSVAANTIHLRAAYDDRPTISTSDVFLEGSKASFARCLKTLLGRDYEFFEQSRQREEAKFLSGPAVNGLLQQFHQFFQKDPVLTITDELSVTINEQLAVTNTPAYQTIHVAPPVQYYFNPARTKASPYPWVGIQQYGPFSKDTFPKRSPHIIVVFPENTQGATETFLRYDTPASTAVGLRPSERAVLCRIVPAGLSMDGAASRGAARRSRGIPVVLATEQPRYLLLPSAGRRPASDRR